MYPQEHLTYSVRQWKLFSWKSFVSDIFFFQCSFLQLPLNNGSHLFRVTSAVIPTNYYISPPGYSFLWICSFLFPVNKWNYRHNYTDSKISSDLNLSGKKMWNKWWDFQVVRIWVFHQNFFYLWQRNGQMKISGTKIFTRWLVGTSLMTHGLVWGLAPKDFALPLPESAKSLNFFNSKVECPHHLWLSPPLKLHSFSSETILQPPPKILGQKAKCNH